MEAIILTIGDEILIGQVVDTNSAWLGQKLSEAGIRVKRILSVSDDFQEIISALQQATEDADIIFTTGGLGPTKDDITKKAIATFLGQKLIFHEPTYERIKKIFEKIGRPMSPAHNDQCLMPENAEILRNSMGTAPGMLFHFKNTKIISMPGVPYEMKAIMEEEVLPKIYETSPVTILHKTILTSGTGETVIENQISDIIDTFPPNVKIAYLPALAQVRLRITCSGQNKTQVEQIVSRYTDQIVNRLGELVYGYDDSSLERELYTLCTAKSISVATAESCTGGMIASKIVSIPGSSIYFQGSIVAYSNDIKEKILHVKPDTLQLYGAVSEQTVIEMVDGVIDLMGVDVAIAVSGIAGPDGGSTEKPVGTVWICAGSKEHKTTFLLKAGKDRTKNIEIASIYALNLLRKFVLEHY